MHVCYSTYIHQTRDPRHSQATDSRANSSQRIPSYRTHLTPGWRVANVLMQLHDSLWTSTPGMLLIEAITSDVNCWIVMSLLKVTFRLTIAVMRSTTSSFAEMALPFTLITSGRLSTAFTILRDREHFGLMTQLLILHSIIASKSPGGAGIPFKQI